MGRADPGGSRSARRRGRRLRRAAWARSPASDQAPGRSAASTSPSSSATPPACSTTSTMPLATGLPRDRHRHHRLGGRRAGSRTSSGRISAMPTPGACRRADVQPGGRAVRRARRAGGASLRRASRTTTRTSWSGTAGPRPTGRPARPPPSPTGCCRISPPSAGHGWRRDRTRQSRDTLEVVALRAGASPGMHVVGFDAPGESIELRITARDRSAYVAGALLPPTGCSPSPRGATASPPSTSSSASC